MNRLDQPDPEKSKRPVLLPAFASALNSVMARHNISKYRFAVVSGLDTAHVSRLTRGMRARPTATTVRKIERAFARLNIPDSEIDDVVVSAGFASAYGSTRVSGERYKQDHSEPEELGPPTRRVLPMPSFFQPANPLLH